MKKFKLISLFVIISVLIIFTGSVAADEPIPTPSEDDVNNIAKNMFCPKCENTPLDVCGTEACEFWREEIADLLMLGYSEDEIYDYFYERHGDIVLSIPRLKGFNLFIYVIPAVALLIGIIFLVRYMRNTTVKVSEEKIVEKQNKASNSYLEKLEEDLKKRN